MKKTLMTLASAALFLSLFSNLASASHFRYANISWQRTTNAGEVVFGVTASFRRGFSGTAPDGLAQTGDIITETIGATEFGFGDGIFTPTLQFIVTAFSPTENWIIGRALQPGTTTEGIRHTYTTAGPFTAGIGSCCRIGALNNGGDGNYIVQSLVTPFGANLPPVTTLVPIVVVPQSASATFVVPASDPDLGDTLRFRLATTAESGVSPSVPPGLTINPATGQVTWNNLGLDTVNFWTTQVIIEDLDAQGNVKSRTPVDFLLRININFANTPPSCLLTENGPLIVAQGSTVNFAVIGNDVDAGDTLVINTGGLPLGAAMTPSLPVAGTNGVTSSFSWTPTAAAAGAYAIQFSVTDTAGAQSLCSITINVLSNVAPNLVKYSLTGGSNVAVGQVFTYELSFDTYTQTVAVAGLRIIDDLPVETDFVSVTTNGALSAVYDLSQHRITWDFGTWPPLSAGPTNIVTVRLNNGALAGANIVNYASIISSNLPRLIVGDRNPRCPTCPPGVVVTSNRAPVAVCQPVVVFNGQGGCTAAVAPSQVNNGSSDPDGDAFTLTLTPAGPYPIGTNVVTLTATDPGGLTGTCTTTIVVIDTVPPIIFCPTNIFVEFTGKTGAVVTYTASAIDQCSGPLPVTFTPPSGSVLPIGVTPVVATARDAAGNSAACIFLVTVVGPHGTKSNLVSELQARVSTLTDLYSRTNLEHGIVQLQSAVKARKWLDQTHVTRAEGEDVFQGEEDIAEKLQFIINHHTSGVPDAIWQGYIRRLLAVDRVLAEVQIDDARRAGASAKKIADALKLINKGDAEVGKNRPDRAIENYFAAWQKALFAVIVRTEPLPNGSVRLTIQGSKGTKYQIQFSTNGGGSWSNLAKPKADANGAIVYLDANPNAATTRTYRILEP